VQKILDEPLKIFPECHPELVVVSGNETFHLIPEGFIVGIIRRNDNGAAVPDDREPLVHCQPLTVEAGQEFRRDGETLVVFQGGALIMISERLEEKALRDMVF
jgi:hypothetical protein